MDIMFLFLELTLVIEFSTLYQITIPSFWQ